MTRINTAPVPILLLVTGLPGTGKSTVANAAAEILGAPVLAHDWAMSALRPYSEVQTALDIMEPPGHRRVGWSILSSLAQAQLRRGRSVVLDGVARTPEIEQCRQLAHEEGSRFVVIFTQCTNPAIHRSRVEGRSRDIPNWYELNWDDVEGSIGTWQPPDHFDLMLDAIAPWEDNAARLAEVLHEM